MLGMQTLVLTCGVDGTQGSMLGMQTLRCGAITYAAAEASISLVLSSGHWAGIVIFLKGERQPSFLPFYAPGPNFLVAHSDHTVCRMDL